MTTTEGTASAKPADPSFSHLSLTETTNSDSHLTGSRGLCCNVHLPTLESGPILESGQHIDRIVGVKKGFGYDYWHYCCDTFDDRGWGCGYRTLQTIASWIIYR